MSYNLEYDPAHTYKTEHFSPDYIKNNPIRIFIESLDNKFETLNIFNLVRGSVKLKQTLCSEEYFLWGGFNASQLTFECFSSQLQDTAPEGKIRLYITPTKYTYQGNGEWSYELLENEKTPLFTGYIETAKRSSTPGNWKVTAYDRLYRVRNVNVKQLVQDFIDSVSDRLHASWADVTSMVQLQLGFHGNIPQWMDGIRYPENADVTNLNGVDLLREFALMRRQFGILDGEGELQYVSVSDRTISNIEKSYYCVNSYDPDKFDYKAGHVWLPKFFVSDPRTNIFYSAPETGNQEEDYFNNVYTIKNSPVLGNSEWVEKMYECDEYGAPSSKYTANNMPTGLFDTKRLCLSDAEMYHQAEYTITCPMDPTIPMGSQILINKATPQETVNGNVTAPTYTNIVESYIMERTIEFTNTQVINCTCSARNNPYNSVVPEYDWGVQTANALANQANSRLPFIADGSSLTKLRAIKSLSKTEYQNLKEKRDDTIYYVYDDGGSTS